jgi:DNA-binding IscR family transcriptional regulator
MSNSKEKGIEKAPGRQWTFLTCHGRVMVYLAKNPHATEREIALEVGVTERAIQNVIHDLVTEGYIVSEKIGRSNRYVLHRERHMRHRLERERSVGDMLKAFGCDSYEIKSLGIDTR